ncbi:MAG: hypothetical protein ACE5KE_15825 [Methanosarcinales archaeon]
MKKVLIYPFPRITINPEEIADFVKEAFISEFGEDNLIDLELDTYPNEYSIELIVHKKDEALSNFISELRELFVKNGLSVILLARQR